MKRYIAVVAVWVAAAALFAAINVQAKPGDIVTPDVVGMTVAEAIQAWADAGFTKVPSVNPGNLDPASVPDAIVVGQSPNSGEPQSAGFHGAIFIEDAVPDPSPSPTPSSTPPGDDGATPTGEVEGDSVGGWTTDTSDDPAGDTAGAAGSLAFTL
jgi:hypothetical protein